LEACGASDGCGGVCNTCTGGKVCTGGACCTPDCTGKACGELDRNCGVTCTGGCAIGEFCAPDQGKCLPDTCSPPCGCGFVCSAGKCVSMCAPGETACDCAICCKSGQSCKHNPTRCEGGGFG
jgi:hypothetical protein